MESDGEISPVGRFLFPLQFLSLVVVAVLLTGVIILDFPRRGLRAALGRGGRQARVSHHGCPHRRRLAVFKTSVADVPTEAPVYVAFGTQLEAFMVPENSRPISGTV